MNAKQTYLITLEVKSQTDPRDWHWGEIVVIDEEYEVTNVEEISNKQ